MDASVGLLFVLLMLGLGTALRVAAHFLDKDRIAHAAALKGWSRVSVHWEPFARGAIFETKERFYSVAFVDRDGVSRRAQCKTSMFMGISWIDPHFPGY